MNKILASALVALLLLSFAAGLVGVWQIKPIRATVLFGDGFETGDASLWDSTTGALTISTTQTHNGDYALMADSSGEYVSQGFSDSTAYVRLYFNLISITNDRVSRFIHVYGGSNTVVMVWLKRVYNGTAMNTQLNMFVRLFDGSSESSGAVGDYISLNTWYSVEVFFTQNMLHGAGLFLNDRSVWNITGTSANTIVEQLNVGYTYLEDASTIYIDDVQVSDIYNGEAVDITGPKYTSYATNCSVHTTPSEFSVLAYDLTNVSAYIFSTNNTGQYVNETAIAFTEFETAFSAWANVTKTLNDTVGVKVGYRWFSNDTLDNWGVSMLNYLVVIDDFPPVFDVIQPDTLYAGDPYLQVSCSITDDVGVSAWAYAWNNTGSWVNGSKVSTSGLVYVANFYGTWNATVSQKVGVQFWANDSKNQAAYSALQTFVLVVEPYLKYRIFTNSTSTYRRNSTGTIDASGISLTVINNAITACNSAGFGNISIYKGTYTIGGTINMKSNVDVYMRNGSLIDNVAYNGDIMLWRNVSNSSWLATNNGTIRGAGAYGYDLEIAFKLDNVTGVTLGATKPYGLRVCRIGAQFLRTDPSPSWTNNSVFQNIWAYDWAQMALYKQGGMTFDGAQNLQLVDVVVDGVGEWSDSALVVGGWMLPCTNITITRGVYKNSKWNNAIYLGGWNQPVSDVHITNVTTYRSGWGGGYAHAGIKCRPACNVTIIGWNSTEDYYGMEMGTAYNYDPLSGGESNSYLTGGSWFNTVEGVINSPVHAGLVLALDGSDKGQSVEFNSFNLVINNCTSGSGIYIENGYSTGGGSISHNTVTVNLTGSKYAGIGMSDATYGPVADNDFFCIFVDNGLTTGYQDIVLLGIEQQINNVFYVYSSSGNPNGLMNFVNGTNGNIVYYPYTGTRSLEILWHTVSTTVVGAVCDFSAYWVGDIGLSFGWLCTNISGVMVNQTAIALTSYADTFVDSATLPLVVGEGVAYIFYANDTGGLTQISATFFLTTTPIPHYYFSWNFKDRDNSNVNSILTYALYDGIIPVPYVKGVANLTAGTYTLVVFYYGYYVNDTTLDTATQGNTTVNIPLEMKHHTIITNGYLVFDEAVTSLVINEQTHYNLTFTVTTTSTNIYIRVPANASFFTIDGTNRTYGGLWTYDDANGVILVDGGYTTYQIGLESWSAPNVSLTQFIIIVFLALGLLGFAPLILVALVLQKKIEPVPVILMITIMVITFAVLYLVVANLMNVV